MSKNILILTDHSGHTSENSLYLLATAMSKSHHAASLVVASRANPENDHFFQGKEIDHIFGTDVSSGLIYNKNPHPLEVDIEQYSLKDFDLIWLRLPPPLSLSFLEYIEQQFSSAVVINNPKAIYETGSKAFLMQFQEVCAPMRLCHTIDDINEYRQAFPIVLKPFRAYGGQGIVRIDGNEVSTGKETLSYEAWVDTLTNTRDLDYLGVKYLKNVSAGDKRIIVINGKVMGASLRLPAEGNWLCNVAMGGRSHIAEVDPDEYELVATVDPILSEKGIVMYGIDTLVGDNGKRVLSELNTTSIGGLPQIAALMKKPLVEEGIELIWDYYNKLKS